MNSTRDTTLDTARGCCMLSILLFHTEVYYTGEEIIPYACHVCNSLLTFTFISGYLFSKTSIKDFSTRHKFRSMIKGMLLPYLFFTIVLAIPKAMVKDDVKLSDELLRVVNGHASWYVAALMVTEVLFILLIRLTRQLPHPTLLLVTGSIVPFLAMATACQFIPNEQLQAINPWCWQSAMLMLPFLCIGLLWKQWDMMKYLDRPTTIVALFIVVAVLKYIVVTHQFTLTLEPIHVSSFMLLFADGLSGAMLILALCRRLPNITPLQFVGRHSLIYYFFCGAVPMAVAIALNKCGMPYQGQYLQVLLAFLLVCIATTAIAWAMVKIRK